MSSIFMEQAILEAKKGIEAGHGGPFGCVIEKQGKIIGVGHNRECLLIMILQVMVKL